VSDLRVDAGGNASTIEVTFEVFQERLASIGGNVQRIQQMAELAVFPNLRTRVVGNPVTGEAYLLLDVPADPPPPVALGFTPDRPYVASMPSPLAVVQDRLPEVLERAEMTLSTLRHRGRIPDSLDRSDQFFTNVERIIRERAAAIEPTRGRSLTTTTQVGQIATQIDALMGKDGTLVQLAEDARAALRDADVPGSTRTAREAADRTSLAADDLRRSLPAIRDSLEQLRELARRLEEQPESVVYGPRQPPSKPR
jgi:hypothetical protein